MPPSNLGALRAVADRLDGLGLSYAFTGGAIVNLLPDDPGLSPARPTDDVDVILEVGDHRTVFRPGGADPPSGIRA